MAITKLQVLAQEKSIPISKIETDKNNSYLITYQDQKYLIFSEKYELRKATWKWVTENGWRIPLEIILKSTIDVHRSFLGINNTNAIAGLKAMQEELKEDFNEIVFSLIHNKTKFFNDIIKLYGYKNIWNPIDGKEIIRHGFRIYRIK